MNAPLQDANGNYDWMLENMSDDDIAGLGSEMIDDMLETHASVAKEQGELDILEKLERATYPRYGYSTGEVIENEEVYREFLEQGFAEQLAENIAEAKSVLLFWTQEAQLRLAKSTPIFITEEHLGEGTEDDAGQMIKAMKARGWNYSYGSGLPPRGWDDFICRENENDWNDCLQQLFDNRPSESDPTTNTNPARSIDLLASVLVIAFVLLLI